MESKELTKLGILKGLLEKSRPSISALLPKHLNPERLIRFALIAVQRQPELMECTSTSILNCVIKASELGIETIGPGGMWIVPFRNKQGQREATPIVDYRALMALVRRSKEVVCIDVGVVYEKDSFDYQQGTNTNILHKRYLGKDRGEILCFYAFAKLANGEVKAEIMGKDEIDAVRARSKAGASGPWLTDYGQMGKKTIVKRLCNYLPMNEYIVKSIELDQRLEEEIGIEDIIGEPVEIRKIQEPKKKDQPPMTESPDTIPNTKPMRQTGEEG